MRFRANELAWSVQKNLEAEYKNTVEPVTTTKLNGTEFIS
jgi:hypothetical protein